MIGSSGNGKALIALTALISKVAVPWGNHHNSQEWSEDVSLYIRKLSEETEAAQRAREVEAKALEVSQIEAARDALRPLSDRVTCLLATIPLAVQREGLSLPTIQARLRGRRGGACNAGELGTALRRLGWTRKRGWRAGAGDGFGASWFPPGA